MASAFLLPVPESISVMSGQEVGPPLPVMLLPGSRKRQVYVPGELGPLMLPQLPGVKAVLLTWTRCCVPPPQHRSPSRTPRTYSHGGSDHTCHSLSTDSINHYTMSTLRPGASWSCHFLNLLTHANSTDFFTFAECTQGGGRLASSRASSQSPQKTRRKFLATQVRLQTLRGLRTGGEAGGQAGGIV